MEIPQSALYALLAVVIVLVIGVMLLRFKCNSLERRNAEIHKTLVEEAESTVEGGGEEAAAAVDGPK